MCVSQFHIILRMDAPYQYTAVEAAILTLSQQGTLEREAADHYLKSYLLKFPQQFLDHVFTMMRVPGTRSLLATMYYRHILHSNRSRMPNPWRVLYQLYCETGNKQFAECLQIYLSRPSSNRQKRQFIGMIVEELSNSLVKGNFNEQLLKFVVATLGGPIEKPGIKKEPMQSNLIFSFMSQVASLEPRSLTNRVLWVDSVISLAQFSGLPLPAKFIYRNLMQDNPLTTYLGLIYFYNQIHRRFTNLQEVYNLIIKNQEVTQTPGIIDTVAEVSIDALETLVLSIRTMLGDAFELGAEVRSVGGGMIIERLGSYEIWSHYIGLFTYVLSEYGQDSPQMVNVIVQTIGVFNEFLPAANIRDYLRIFQESAAQHEEAIYCLLSAMPHTVLEEYGASRFLMKEITNFLSVSSRNFSPVFMQFVIRYVTVYEYFPNADIQNAVQQFAEVICSSEIDVGSSIELFRFKAQAMVILCRMQKFYIDKSVEAKTHFCSQFLSQSLRLLHEMNEARILENSSEVIEIIMEGLEYLTRMPLLPAILHSQLISQLIPTLSVPLTHDQTHICSHLVHYATTTFSYSHLTPLTIKAANLCLYSNNEALQSQACSLLLKILYEINHNRAPEECHEQIACIMESQILEFIDHKLTDRNDEPIYSKILIELSIHEQARDSIVGLLTKISSGSDLECYWNSLKVWEAMVILWGVENDFTRSRGINYRINEIRDGNCEKMLGTLSLEDKEVYMRETQNDLQRVRWAKLPDNKLIVELGSAAGELIEQRLNQVL